MAYLSIYYRDILIQQYYQVIQANQSENYLHNLNIIDYLIILIVQVNMLYYYRYIINIKDYTVIVIEIITSMRYFNSSI